MNRSLHTIHEPRDHPQDKELLRRIESLEKRQSGEHPDGGGQSLEEKMALMEKSYELAARYNGKQTTAAPAADRKERTAARPVKQVRQQVVSSLSRPANDEEGIAGERNTGFHTPVGKTLSPDRNTIAACVHGTQTVSDGQALRLRLLEPMAVDDRLIPKGTLLTGSTRIRGNGWTYSSRRWNTKGRSFRWSWKCMTPTAGREYLSRTRWNTMPCVR